MTYRPSTPSRRAWNRSRYPVHLLALLAAYLGAVISLVSYVSFNAGTGMPSRLQLALMILPIGLIYYLSVRSTLG